MVLEDCTVVSNEATFFAASAGGAKLDLGAVLESIDTDWGAAGTDNSPFDIELRSGVVFGWPGVASFVCDDDLDTCQ